jgi:hypothetical protein
MGLFEYALDCPKTSTSPPYWPLCAIATMGLLFPRIDLDKGCIHERLSKIERFIFVSIPGVDSRGLLVKNYSDASVIPGGAIVLGRVTLDGKPLDEVCITFVNAATTQGTGIMTNADGRYEIISNRDGTMARGLPPGDYLVSVAPGRNVSDAELHDRIARPFQPANTPAPPPAKPVRTDVPSKYQNYNTSGLSIRVVAGENRPYDFDLTSEKK